MTSLCKTFLCSQQFLFTPDTLYFARAVVEAERTVERTCQWQSISKLPYHVWRSRKQRKIVLAPARLNAT